MNYARYLASGCLGLVLAWVAGCGREPAAPATSPQGPSLGNVLEDINTPSREDVRAPEIDPAAFNIDPFSASLYGPRRTETEAGLVRAMERDEDYFGVLQARYGETYSGEDTPGIETYLGAIACSAGVARLAQLGDLTPFQASRQADRHLEAVFALLDRQEALTATSRIRIDLDDKLTREASFIAWNWALAQMSEAGGYEVSLGDEVLDIRTCVIEDEA